MAKAVAANTSSPAWRRPMVARRPDEPHRASTNLELLFDLCFVVAVSQASDGLRHAVTDGHLRAGITGYASVFFAIWWAWMNFTWFASAYDTDDVPYRLATLVQIAGALIIAAGVPQTMAGSKSVIVPIGYSVMRLATSGQWLRAAGSDPPHRRTCLRYAGGVALVQLGWLARIAVPGAWVWPTFLALVVAELAVPVWAERPNMTPWHPRHIAERYGLFTLIVLGETILSATVAVQTALDDDAALGDLATVAVGGLLTVFAMWWLYFAKEAAGLLTSLRASLVWGYGHYFVFASAAAVGAGLAVNVDHEAHHGHTGDLAAGLAFALPVAVFVLAVWVLQVRPHHQPRRHAAAAPVAAAAALATAATPFPVLLTGLVMAVLVGSSLVGPPSQGASGGPGVPDGARRSPDA